MPIGLTTLLPFPFPWSVVPTEPPDLPCFTSLRRVHAEEGKCLRRWSGASKRPSQAGGEGGGGGRRDKTAQWTCSDAFQSTPHAQAPGRTSRMSQSLALTGRPVSCRSHTHSPCRSRRPMCGRRSRESLRSRELAWRSGGVSAPAPSRARTNAETTMARPPPDAPPEDRSRGVSVGGGARCRLDHGQSLPRGGMGRGALVGGQRPRESSDPTQHAKGRTGDCPGPRKGATTRRNVTQEPPPPPPLPGRPACAQPLSP